MTTTTMTTTTTIVTRLNTFDFTWVFFLGTLSIMPRRHLCSSPIIQNVLRISGCAEVMLVGFPPSRRKPLTVGKYRRTDCSLVSLGWETQVRRKAARRRQTSCFTVPRVHPWIYRALRVEYTRSKTNDILIRDKRRSRRRQPGGMGGGPRFYERKREKMEIDNLEETRGKSNPSCWHLASHCTASSAQWRWYLSLYNTSPNNSL